MSRRENNIKRMKEARKRRRILRESSACGGREKTNNERHQMTGGKFTHITLNNGHSYLVPADKVIPATVRALWSLVKAGGGPIPVSQGLSFCLTSDSSYCCAFSIYKNSVPILMCVYHEESEKPQSLWNGLLSVNARFGVGQNMKMPAGPWLAVVLLPTAFLAAGDLAMLADFEQCVAETWRQLPVSDRSPIRSPMLEGMVKNLNGENPADEGVANGRDTLNGTPLT